MAIARRKARRGSSDRWHRLFTTPNGTREFMYFAGAPTKAELKPHIKHIKRQGDLYRITKHKRSYALWDARV